jgi:hypothetical protein
MTAIPLPPVCQAASATTDVERMHVRCREFLSFPFSSGIGEAEGG